MERSTYGHVIDWNDVIKKEARGINNADLGEVQEVDEDYIITEKGTINKEKFYLPKSIPHGFNGHVLLFNITEKEAKEKYLRNKSLQSSSIDESDISTARGYENRIQVIEERLAISKKETVREARILKKPLKDTKTMDMELTHEELIIEKRPAEDKFSTSASPSLAGSSFSHSEPTQSKTEITIPLEKEEVVVSKKPYIKEEIVISKKSVTETRTINEQLKSEKVSIIGPNGQVIEEEEEK
jgi:uncharacterized protein (TIGR02271 family)